MLKTIHYWVVTPTAEIPVSGVTMREALDEAMTIAEGCVLLKQHVTVLHKGNIVWVSQHQ
jgi:hypothetical protein